MKSMEETGWSDCAPQGLEEIRRSLREWLSEETWLKLTVNGDRAVLEPGPGALFERRIAFTDVSGPAEGEYDLTYPEEPEVESSGDGYTVSWRLEDGAESLALRFAGVRLKVRSLRPVEPPALTPWGCLQFCARGIMEKELTSGVTLTPREIELLPLARELCALMGQAETDPGAGEAELPVLTGYIEELGDLKLLSALRAAERDLFDEMRRGRTVAKLIALFNRAEHEPLWRRLYGAFEASWEGAPTRAEALTPGEELRSARERTEKLLRSRGYGGEYPNFFRTGPIRGVRLANAYGQSFFVGPERRAAFFVTCRERCGDGELLADYLCGTQVLRRGQEPGDIFTCLFDSGGHSYAQTVDAIADRRGSVKLIAFLSAAMGLMFGALLTAACALAAAIIGLVLSGPGEVLPLLAGIPWWAVFLASAALFGATMGWVLAVLGKK